MSTIDHARPPKLYVYGESAALERALTLGEFRLRPPADALLCAQAGKSEQILPFKPVGGGAAQGANFLTLSLNQVWDESLFDLASGVDSCLIINNAEEFGERIHRAAQKALPSWAGIDAAISYGMPSPLGAVFSKAKSYARQKEWLFAWRPTQATMSLNPILIRIGSIEDIAELRAKPV